MKPWSVKLWMGIWIVAVIVVPTAIAWVGGATIRGASDLWFLVPTGLALLFIILLVVVAWKQDGRTRYCIEHGLCVHCGYNRSGIDAEAPCPECGKS